jgi:hypothetical protein
MYANNYGMRDDFIAFWEESARRWKDVPGILAYELINEPFAGNVYKNPLLFLPGMAGSRSLSPFYAPVFDAIRKIDEKTLIMYEPVTWGMIFNNNVLGSGFTEVPGGSQYADRSILSYHYYCWWLYSNVNGTFDGLSKASCNKFFFPEVISAVHKDVKKIGGAVFLTEFGGKLVMHSKFVHIVRTYCIKDILFHFLIEANGLQSPGDERSVDETHALLHETDKYFASWTNWYLCAGGKKRFLFFFLLYIHIICIYNIYIYIYIYIICVYYIYYIFFNVHYLV